MSSSVNSNLSQNPKTSLVLVVDDDRGMRILLRQIMEREGYQVIEAENGRQALEAYQHFQPEVVLLDGLMPVMDGFTCCQQIHALYSNQPAIMMVTNLDDPESVDRAFAAGAIDYVTKPIHPTILRQKVLRITQQSQLVRQLQQTNAALEQHTKICSIASEDRATQIQRALALEATLKRITDRVRDSLDETQIMQTAVDELASALNTIRCNAGFYDYEKHVSSVRYEHTTNSISYQNHVFQMDICAEIYQQVLQGVSTQFCPLVVSSSKRQTAIFVFPIKYEKQPIGDIRLTCKAQRTLDDLETRLVKQVANQCAIAIRQARLHQAAQAQVKELERLNQLKDDFLSTVSHELRSPMANIQIAVQLLDNLASQVKEQYGDTVLQNPNYAKGLTYLQIIKAECDQEINLINDLLDLQRLEVGDQPVDLVPIDLKEWLPHLIQPFLERAQQRQQNLQFHLAPDLSPIDSHPNSLNRILSELLHNACKYTPPGEEITLSVNFHPSFNIFQFSVTNTGVEISLEEQDRIFDKFYRVSNGDRWKQGGTGLGLALVKRIVESLNGSIQVTSYDLQTCFTVQLPFRATYSNSTAL
ncbi:MAG: response regulator [Cyanobacteria bacterium CRU_2_1]|nr:response regulator [Cyanobacteria bacterium RU_5_0]NJR62261.1 response regulator [Cyanobacteria bacterium CRU_2_1]